MTLPSLIQRLEEAVWPDKKLDKDVLLACGWRIDPDALGIAAASEIWIAPNGDEYDAVAGIKPLPNPTASIDAALTLVPEGYAYKLEGWDAFTASVFVPENRFYRAHTKTNMALALCIAALKSRLP